MTLNYTNDGQGDEVAKLTLYGGHGLSSSFHLYLWELALNKSLGKNVGLMWMSSSKYYYHLSSFVVAYVRCMLLTLPMLATSPKVVESLFRSWNHK